MILSWRILPYSFHEQCKTDNTDEPTTPKCIISTETPHTSCRIVYHSFVLVFPVVALMLHFRSIEGFVSLQSGQKGAR